MERYTQNLSLPKILKLTTLPGCSESEEMEMIMRTIMLHTPTGGLVEIIPSQLYVAEKRYKHMSFCERESDSESYRYTAVLLNKPHTISDEAGMRAMHEVAMWYTDLYMEVKHLTSMKWVDYPEGL